MTLFTAEGMLRALAADPAARDALVIEEIRRAYLDWLDTQQGGGATKAYGGALAQSAVLRHPRAPGNTCLSALRAGGHGTVEAPINHSKGCGGVMRTAPIGLVRTWDAERCFRLGCAATALTHGHPGGWLPGGAMAHLVRQLVDGIGLAEAAASTVEQVAADGQGAEVAVLMREVLRRAETPASDPYVDIKALGEGWVGDEALAIGVYAALRGRNVVDAIRIAANHDGDSDSTASIAAQIIGAASPVDDLPYAWVRRLDVIDEVLTIASRLLDADQKQWNSAL
jgi:ADP-ribosylglycohydrolase